jgi:hypothetical protein
LNKLAAGYQFPVSANGRKLIATNHRTGFQREMQEIFQPSMLMGFQFFAGGTLWTGMSHIFLLKLLEPVLCCLKSMFPFTSKIKYQRFNENGRPFD